MPTAILAPLLRPLWDAATVGSVLLGNAMGGVVEEDNDEMGKVVDKVTGGDVKEADIGNVVKGGVLDIEDKEGVEMGVAEMMAEDAIGV